MAFFSFALHSACVLQHIFDDPLSCFRVVSRAGRAGRTRPEGTATGHGRRGAQKAVASAGRAERIALAESKLMSFTAGFKLAWGMAKELEADGFYSFEWEEEEHICRPAEQVDA